MKHRTESTRHSHFSRSSFPVFCLPPPSRAPRSSRPVPLSSVPGEVAPGDFISQAPLLRGVSQWEAQ